MANTASLFFRGQKILLLILLLFSAFGALQAGTIGLEPQTQVQVEGRNLRVTVRLKNIGTEAAYEVFLRFWLGSYHQTVFFSSRLDVSSTATREFLLTHVPFPQRGVFLLHTLILYKDVNEYPFSNYYFALATVGAKGNPPDVEILFPQDVTLCAGDYFSAVISQSYPGSRGVEESRSPEVEKSGRKGPTHLLTLQGTFSLFLPDELRSPVSSIPLTLAHENHSVSFRIDSVRGRPGTPYPAALTFDFQDPYDPSIHQVVYKNFVVQVVSRRWFEWSWKGFLLPGALFLFILFLTIQIPVRTRDQRAQKQQERCTQQK